MEQKNNFKFLKKSVLSGLMCLAFTPALLASSLGFKQIQIVATLRKIKALMNAGKSLWTAVTAATGGGWVASVIVQFLVAWGIDAVLHNSWLATF